MNTKVVTMSQIIGENGIFVDGDWVESKDQDPNGSVRLIQLADIGDGYFIDKSKRYLTKESALNLKCTFLKQNDILIARMPDPIGRACIFPHLDTECVTVVDVCIVRPEKSLVLPEYLKYLINNHEFRRKIQKYVTGTTRQRISRGNLAKIEFKLPPLDQQKRIVALLDQSDELRQKRKEVIGLFDEYLKSVFLDMFGNPMNNPKQWPCKKFSSIGELDRGVSKHRPRNAPELLGGVHPLIQTGDISNSGIYIENYKSTYSDIGLKQSKKWPKGTLCITIAANIAKTGILSFDSCFPDSVVGFTADNKQTRNEFIHFWISFLQEMLEKTAPESAQKNINLQILRNLDVFMPPLELQIKFANIVEKCVMMRKKMVDQSNNLDRHFHFLMHKHLI